MTGAGDWNRIKQDISQHEYKDEKERTWETFFALTITIGYDYGLLDNLIKTLIMANIIETLADLYPKENPPVIPNTELQHMAGAAIILPSEIFPLPPINISTP